MDTVFPINKQTSFIIASYDLEVLSFDKPILKCS